MTILLPLDRFQKEGKDDDYMALIIETVNPDAVYEGKIYSFQVTARLSNGRLILIEDWLRVDIRKFVGQEKELLLHPTYVKLADNSDQSNSVFHGIYRGEFRISEEWKGITEALKEVEWYLFESTDSFFLLLAGQVQELNLIVGQEYSLSLDLFELRACKDF